MATNKESRKEYWKRKWLSKYRLIVMDDSTYEEKTSFRLSRLNIFVFGSLFAFVLIVLTTILIIYSPLRQYILGYTDTASFNISDPKYDPKAYRVTPNKQDSILRQEVEQQEQEQEIEPTNP